MKVTLLGTGSIYSKSNCAGILIDENTLVDIGPGVIKHLLKNNFKLANIDTIILTHLHFDHISDLPLFLVYSDETKVNHKIKIYGPRGAEEKIRNLCRLLNSRKIDRFIDENVDFIDVTKGSSFDIHQHIVEAYEVLHGYIEAYAFIIDSKLGISGDCAICENVKHLAKTCQSLICDCSFEVGDEKHMGIDNIIELINLNENINIIPTHYRDSTREKLHTLHLPHIDVVDDGYTFSI